MDQIEKTRKTLDEGSVIIYPTETAYALGADALNPEAIEKVYKLKQRPTSKGLTVIVDSLKTVKEYADLSENEEKLVEEFMPGPLTLVVDKKDSVPDELNEKFVFRISSSETARQLGSKPVVATSANISGRETSYSVEDISRDITENVDHIINEGKLEKSPTSTISEVGDKGIILHREGPISREELEALLE